MDSQQKILQALETMMAGAQKLKQALADVGKEHNDLVAENERLWQELTTQTQLVHETYHDNTVDWLQCEELICRNFGNLSKHKDTINGTPQNQ